MRQTRRTQLTVKSIVVCGAVRQCIAIPSNPPFTRHHEAIATDGSGGRDGRALEQARAKIRLERAIWRLDRRPGDLRQLCRRLRKALHVDLPLRMPQARVGRAPASDGWGHCTLRKTTLRSINLTGWNLAFILCGLGRFPLSSAA